MKEMLGKMDDMIDKLKILVGNEEEYAERMFLRGVINGLSKAKSLILSQLDEKGK